jgi:hypothetical protein
LLGLTEVDAHSGVGFVSTAEPGAASPMLQAAELLLPPAPDQQHSCDRCSLIHKTRTYHKRNIDMFWLQTVE